MTSPLAAEVFDIAEWSGANSGTFTPADNMQCVPLCSYRGNLGNDFNDDRMVNIKINSAGGGDYHVSQSRGGGAGTINTKAWVVEFNSGVVVRTGTVTLTGATSGVGDADLSDLTHAFLVFYYETTDTSDDYDDAQVRGRLTGTGPTGNVAFDRQAGNGTIEITFWVIEDPAILVEHIIATTGVGLPITLEEGVDYTAVDLTKTIIMGSVTSPQNSGDARRGNGYWYSAGDASPEQILFQPWSTPSGSQDYNLDIITFSGSEECEDKEERFILGTGDSFDDVTLNRTYGATDRAVFQTVPLGYGAVNQNGGDGVDQGLLSMDFTSGTVVRGNRAVTGESGRNGFNTIEWHVGSVSGGTFDEAFTAALTAAAAVGDTIDMPEAFTAALTLAASIADTIDMPEAVLADLTVAAAFGGGLDFQDSFTAAMTLAAAVNGQRVLNEAVASGMTLSAAIADTVEMSQAVVAALSLGSAHEGDLDIDVDVAAALTIAVANIGGLNFQDAFMAALDTAAAVDGQRVLNKAVAAGMTLAAANADTINTASAVTAAMTLAAVFDGQLLLSLGFDSDLTLAAVFDGVVAGQTFDEAFTAAMTVAAAVDAVIAVNAAVAAGLNAAQAVTVTHDMVDTVAAGMALAAVVTDTVEMQEAFSSDMSLAAAFGGERTLALAFSAALNVAQASDDTIEMASVVAAGLTVAAAFQGTLPAINVAFAAAMSLANTHDTAAIVGLITATIRIFAAVAGDRDVKAAVSGDLDMKAAIEAVRKLRKE